MLPKRIRPFIVLPVLLALLFLSLVVFFSYSIQNPSVQRVLLKRFTEVTGYHVSSKKIEINLWGGLGLLAHELVAKKDKGQEGFTASKARIILDPSQLIRGRIVPISLHLTKPKITLIRKTDEGSAPPLFWIPGLHSISVEQGTIKLDGFPFDLEDLHLDASQKNIERLTLMVSCQGKFKYQGVSVPFGIRGTLSQQQEKDRIPYVDVEVESQDIPLDWVPWPEAFKMKGGTLEPRLNIKVYPDGPVVKVGGNIRAVSTNMDFYDSGRKKNYGLDLVSIDFEAFTEGKRISIPSLQMKTKGTAINLALKLDLREEKDATLQLAVNTPFMPIQTLKDLFPTPLLPTWFDNRLFPILKEGDVRLAQMVIKGTFDQINNLDLPKNRSVLHLAFDCKNFKVHGKGYGLPFQNVSAKVVLKNGQLVIGGLESELGQSKLEKARLDVENVFGASPTFQGSIKGVFDLNDLVQQTRMDFIPPELREHLNMVKTVTGKLECETAFRYEGGWDFPRITKGKFLIKDCTIEDDAFVFPLVFSRAEILVDETSNNLFKVEGAWGGSRFETTTYFRIKDGQVRVEQADISALVDMNRVVPSLYPMDQLPLKFTAPIPWYLSLARQKDQWTVTGRMDLKDVAFETDKFIIDPVGKEDRITFDLKLTPKERIDLRECILELSDTTLKLSGIYHFDEKESYTLKAITSSLSLDDLGLRFKQTNNPAKGTLMGLLGIRGSMKNPLDLKMTGNVIGNGFSFDLQGLASRVEDCGFALNFSGKKVEIESIQMKVGESPLLIEGALIGWNGLKGDIRVNAGFMDIADFVKSQKDPDRKQETPKENTGRPQEESFLDKTDIHFTLDTHRGRWKKIEWRNAQANFDFRGKDVYLQKAKFLLDRGLVVMRGHFKKGPDREIHLLSHIWLNDQPIEDLLQSLGLENKTIQGRLTTETILFLNGRNKEEFIRNLKGGANILIKKGNIKRSHAMIKILNFLSLQKIYKKRPPDLSKEGFYFESLGAHAAIDSGVLSTENLTIKSPILNAFGVGELDLAAKKVDFDMGTQPLGTVDTVVGSIPILGFILGGKDKAVLSYYFEVKGPLFKPEVKYVPFKNLGKEAGGILKRLFLSPAKLFKDLSKATKHLSEQELLPDDEPG